MDFIPMRNPASPMDDMAQLAADQAAYQRRQQLAQALLGSGYIPNSGKMGVLTSVLSSLAGGMMQRSNNESVTDLMRRTFEQQSKAETAKRQREMEDEARKFQEDIAKEREKAKAQKEFAKPEFTGGGVFDPSTGKYSANQDWMNQQLGLKQAEARIAAANRAPAADPFADISKAMQLGVITPEQAKAAMQRKLLGGGQQGAPSGYRFKDDGSLEAITGGPADPNAPARPQPLTAEAKTKLSLIDNALANARKFQERVVGPNGEFKDIESMTGDTPQLMRSAIQDMLYAKSGASAPVEEVRKAEAMYGPSRALGGLIPTERDSTAVAKVGNFISDLQRMRDEIGSTTGQPAQGAAIAQAPAQGQPTATAVNPQTGQRIGLINGQWVPL